MPPSVLIFFGGWHGRSWLLGVCGTNEYTDAQVGDAGGLFESLDPAPCGAVPVHPVYRSSSSLPTSYPVPVYLPHIQFQSTSSSAPVPVHLPHIQFQSTYLISSSSLLRPVLQFQSTYLISSSSLLRPVLQFQSTCHPSAPSSNAGSPGLSHFRGLPSLQGLIFIACGISLLCKDSSSITAHLNGRDFFEMYWFFCVCVYFN